MRYFLDTEYLDDGTSTELVSIGLVADDGREFFAVSSEFDAQTASKWVRENVLSLLPARDDPVWMPRKAVRHNVEEFVGQYPEFWSVCAAWDWYLLVRLFGGLNDLPATWPMACWDLWQWALHLGDPALPTHAGREHHALEDARWHKVVYDALDAEAKKRQAVMPRL